MKKLFSLMAALLICLMVLAPCAALASGEDADTVGVTATGAEGTDYSQYSRNLIKISDGEGNSTRNYSLGMSCGANGISLFTGHDYALDFAYIKGNAISEDLVPQIKIINCPSDIQAKYLTVENNTVKIRSGNENYSFSVVFMEDGKEIAPDISTFNVTKFKVDFTDILLLGIGVYALVTAITGTGSMFRNDFVKDGMEDKFKKTVRISAAIVGLCMIAVALISIFGVKYDNLSILKYILFGIAVVVLIGSMVLTSRMTDKEKRAKAQASGGVGGPSNSAAAFEFDENEPTIDDVLADIEQQSKDNGENR